MYFIWCARQNVSPSRRGEKLTRKLFHQATELMAVIDLEFVENSTSPPFAFLSCPIHTGISLPLAKRLIGVFFGTRMGAKNPSPKCAQTLILCTCEHERKYGNRMLTEPIA